MNATQLFLKDGKETHAFYCEKCRIIHQNKHCADECCAPLKCPNCGGDRDKYRCICSSCETAKEAQKERERFEAAEKVSEYDGPVYSEGYGYSDGYFGDVSELVDHLENEDEGDIERPAYAWACAVTPTVQASIEDITNNIEFPDGQDDDDLFGLDELESAIEKFNSSNSKLETWQVEYKKAVLISPANPEPKL